MEAKLGDYVVTSRHGYKGRVCSKHPLFEETNHDKDWLDMQSIPVTEEQVEGNWYKILCEGGGSILVPEDCVTIVEPFDLNNIWEDFYWEKK